jgi:hypothetical protein
MKPNKTSNIIFLFISHIYIYAFVYLILYNLIKYLKTGFFILEDFLIMTLLSPISLLFMEGLCILFYPVIFLIINYFKPNNPISKTYMVSAFLTTFLTFTLLYIFNEYYLNIVVMSYDGKLRYNKLFFMIPSLLVAVFLNKMIFRKTFKRLDTEYNLR